MNLSEFRRAARAISIVSLLAAPVFAQGPTVTGDTYLQSGANVAQNFGALANMLVGPGTGAPTQNRGLIRFDLSGLSGVAASDVQKAVLWLYVNRVTTTGAIDVYDVTSSWSESTATWNSPPTAGATQGTIPVTSAGQWVGLDLTTLVGVWLTTPAMNNGVMLQASTAPTTAVTLDAKESTATSHPAQLQIVLHGPAGATGPVGAAGPTGATGAAGAAGATGPAGTTGPAGETGAAGAAGAAGPTGATGVAGAAGAAGATGAAGAGGATGATGVAGAAGAAGATGATGANGNTVLSGTGAPSNGLGVDGDFYLRTDTSCMYGPKASGAWPGACTTLVGPAGATGAAGTAGATGATGTAGTVGPTGATGATGANGTAGTNGANGATGATGVQGLTGSAGPTGATGATGSAAASLLLGNSFNPTGLNFFLPVTGAPNATGSGFTTYGQVSIPVPVACTVDALSVSLFGTGGSSSNTQTITVYRNGSATGVTCTASSPGIGSSSSCSDTSHSQAFSAGDTIAVFGSQSNNSPIYRIGTGIRCR
jgi:hypothetical protein